MVIESTCVKTIIDLLESLRKNSFTATEIRVSYTQRGSKKQYITFATLDTLKADYITKYAKQIQSKRSPYTSDPMLALQEPVSTTVGQQLFNTYNPYEIYFEASTFFCNTGSLVTLESFNLTSYMKEYQMSFNVKDVTSSIKIIDGSRFDLRRQDQIAVVVARFKSAVQDFISTYNKIYGRLNRLFVQGQYVDLCYATIGYVEFTFELYKLFFAINKTPIDAGITDMPLKRMYLRATP